MITAVLNNYRQSPRKVRLVTDLVKGKTVEHALYMLQFLTKRAALPVEKLLASAVANAKNNHGVEKADLIVRDIRVEGGIVLKRSMPRARGRAFPIKKRTSRVTLTLDLPAVKAAKVVKAKKVKAPAAAASK